MYIYYTFVHTYFIQLYNINFVYIIAFIYCVFNLHNCKNKYF